MDAPKPNPGDIITDPNRERRALLNKYLRTPAAVWANSLISSEAGSRLIFQGSTPGAGRIGPDQFTFQPGTANHVPISHNPYDILSSLQATPPNGHALDEAREVHAIPRTDPLAQEVSRKLINESIKEMWKKAALVQKALKEQRIPLKRETIIAKAPAILKGLSISCSDRERHVIFDVLYLNSLGVKRDALINALDVHFTTPIPSDQPKPPKQRNPEIPQSRLGKKRK